MALSKWNKSRASLAFNLGMDNLFGDTQAQDKFMTKTEKALRDVGASTKDVEDVLGVTTLPKKSKTTSIEKSAETPTETTYDAYGSYGAGGGGVSGPQRIDLTDILASYEQGAKAQEKAVRDSGESQRQSLLNSLKRFQEETAEARNQQRRSYNASRADLEGQAFMANRQALQNAAARGLGGSGLQQLAQLQNLINQSTATDKLAQSNTDVLKQLATAARNKEEDTNTALLNLDKDTANRLSAIAANNAQARAELQYKEAVRYEQARQAAEQLAAQLSASNAAIANSKAEAQAEEETILKNLFSSAVRDINNAYDNTQGIKNKNKATTAETKAALDNVINNYKGAFLESTNPYASTYAQQLDQLYNKFYNRGNN